MESIQPSTTEKMSTEITIQAKLKKLLDLFLEPEYKIKNDVYISTLLTHIKSTDEEGQKLMLQTDLFSKWILNTVDIWELNGVKTDPLITSFLLNVLSELSQIQMYYLTFEENNIYDKLLKIFDVTGTSTPHIVKLGIVRMFKALLTSCDGLQWLRRTGLWQSILNINSSNATIYLNRETQNSITEILKITATKNVEFCKEVLEKIIEPLVNNCQFSYCTNSNTFSEINQEQFYVSVKPSLNLLNFILEDILCNSEDKSDCEIVKICRDQFPLKQCLLNYMNIVNHKSFVYDISRVLILLELYNLFLSVELSSVLRYQLDIFKKNLNKEYFDNVYKLSSASFVISRKVLEQLTKQHNEDSRNYFNQLLAIQLLPLLMVPKVQLGQNIVDNCGHDQSFQKCLNAVLPINYIIEMNEFLILWQQHLVSQVQETRIAIGILSYLMASNKVFSASDVKIFHKCFIFLVKETSEIQKTANYKMSTNFSTFLVQVLEASCTLCVEFDSLTEGLHFILELVKLLDVPISYRIVEKTLKLINLIVKRYLIPHKASFDDQAYNMLVTSVVPVLYRKLSDEVWEVRDSTIEVFTSLINLSDIQFPLLQKTLIDLKLPKYILTKAVYDSESFVRVTGCQCLSAMTKIDEFWRDLDEPRDLINCLIQAFDNEDEGIVRKEIISTIREVHHSRQIATQLLYKVMVKAVYDFYWEVKMEALKFWEIVILLSFDKIITPETVFLEDDMESSEIPDADLLEQVFSVLRELSENGCLKVLIDALQDDCDIEVAKFTFNIVHKLKTLFCRYKLTSEDLIALESKNAANISSVESHEHHLSNQQGQNLTSLPKTVVKPSEFILVIQQDFSALIEDRKKWLKGIDELDSLLNDMLKNYEDEFNDMDCY